MEEMIPTFISKTTSLVYRVLLASFLLVISNFPLAFSLAVVEMHKQIILTFVLLSVTLLPSMVAINYALWKPVKVFQELEIVKRFWQSYKKNFKQSWACSILGIAVLYVFTFDYFYVEDMISVSFIKYGILLVLFYVFMVLIAMSGMIARYYLPVRVIIKNSLLLSIKYGLAYFGATFLLVLMLVLSKGMSLFILQVLFWPVLAYLGSSVTSQTLIREEISEREKKNEIGGN